STSEFSANLVLNNPPVANNDAYSTNEDTALTVAAPGVLANDTDADGDPLTAVFVAGPGHGTVTLNSNGSFTSTPTANYNGPDSFTYKANDGKADSNVATVSITVTAVNDAPVLGVFPTTFEVVKTTTLSFTVTADDVDLDPTLNQYPNPPRDLN